MARDRMLANAHPEVLGGLGPPTAAAGTTRRFTFGSLKPSTANPPAGAEEGGQGALTAGVANISFLSGPGDSIFQQSVQQLDDRE